MVGIKVKKSRYGLLSDGKKVHLYTVSNGRMSFSVTDYGCIITSIIVPDKKKKNVDVTLGFSTLDGFITNTSSFGAIVGRFANRIGGASFNLEGKTYTLDKNDNGINTLHGGLIDGIKKFGLLGKLKLLMVQVLNLQKEVAMVNRDFLAMLIFL